MALASRPRGSRLHHEGYYIDCSWGSFRRRLACALPTDMPRIAPRYAAAQPSSRQIPIPLDRLDAPIC
jgi:hypothetical protein